MSGIQQRDQQQTPPMTFNVHNGHGAQNRANSPGDVVPDQLGIGVITVDFSSRVCLVNAHGQALFEHVVQAGDSLPDVLGLAPQSWERAVSHALSGRRGVVRTKWHDQPISLTVLPCADAARANHLVVLAEPAISELDDGLEQFAQRYRLTVAESQVFHGLVNGQVPKQIARTRRVALSTVRYQVKQILHKTGESSVNAMVIRAIRCAALESDAIQA